MSALVIGAASEAPRTAVRSVLFSISARARLTNRVLRWVVHSSARSMLEAAGLLRLRRHVALMDRVAGALRIGRTEHFAWRRSSVNSVRVREVRPALNGGDDAPILLYLHGGAFLLRALNGHMNLASAIARSGGLSRAILPIYRLAPEHPFPAGLDDCTRVYRGLLQHGTPGHRIVLAGDSAGGGLVLKLMMRLRDKGLALPICAVLLSPFTDMSCSGDSVSANAALDPMFGGLPAMHARFYLGATSALDPRCSPLFGDFRDLPPVLAQVGSTELGLPESRRAVDGIGQFIRCHTARSPLEQHRSRAA